MNYTEEFVNLVEKADKLYLEYLIENNLEEISKIYLQHNLEIRKNEWEKYKVK